MTEAEKQVIRDAAEAGDWLQRRAIVRVAQQRGEAMRKQGFVERWTIIFSAYLYKQKRKRGLV